MRSTYCSILRARSRTGHGCSALVSSARAGSGPRSAGRTGAPGSSGSGNVAVTGPACRTPPTSTRRTPAAGAGCRSRPRSGGRLRGEEVDGDEPVALGPQVVDDPGHRVDGRGVDVVHEHDAPGARPLDRAPPRLGGVAGLPVERVEVPEHDLQAGPRRDGPHAVVHVAVR